MAIRGQKKKPYQPGFELTIEDLVRAYRNAKVDCFHERGQLNASKFALYERDLLNNLEQLRLNILSGQEGWIDEDFIGEHVVQLKKIDVDDEKNLGSSSRSDSSVFYSSKKRSWDSSVSVRDDYRIAGVHSVDFHVLSSLWIEKVGVVLERRVGDCSYGSRLKQYSGIPADEEVVERYTGGHFRPYYEDYKNWQREGIKTIETQLKNGNSIVAITTDVTRFYHRICPEFLLHSDFLEALKADPYTRVQERVTELLVYAIRAWSNNFPDWYDATYTSSKRDHCGIPITLAASRVIANLLLTSFDEEVLNEVSPVYYGRYVDDIFLVLQDRGQIKERVDVWTYLSNRIPGLRKQEQADEGWTYKIPFAEHTRVEFGKDKEKLFFLEGSSGEAFIDALTESLNEMSSEWRMLPDCEDDLENLAKEIAKTAAHNNDEITGLRKADSISVQRLKFALHLRNFGIVVRLLPKELWLKGVRKFFKLTIDVIIAPERLHTYSPYHSRLVQLAIAADEPGIAVMLWTEIDKAWEALLERSKEPVRCRRAQDFDRRLRVEAVCATLNPFGNIQDGAAWTKFFELVGQNHDELKRASLDFFFADLHHIPFKQLYLQTERFLGQVSSLDLDEIADYFIDDELQEVGTEYTGIKRFLRAVGKDFFEGSIPKALLLYTRRFSVVEVTELVSDWASGSTVSGLNDHLAAFNRRPIPAVVGDESDGENSESALRSITILQEESVKSRNPVLALTSFQTLDESWVAHVREDGIEPDTTRYLRLFKLTNSILACKAKRINYVVFPELSLPRSILKFVAEKLGRAGISTIAGVEYEMRDAVSGESPTIRGLVSNQLVYILDLPNYGFRQQVMIVQEKTIPAIHEEHDLFAKAGKRLAARSEAKYLITHREFTFTGLICNDLLNIDNRQSIRGKADALIIVEWNKDVDMYDSIVQSTASDLHTFVVQVNNRLYGDTRLRGPYKLPYKRDMVRVRGGELDYFVVSTIDAIALREFQRNFRSPDEPFKPVPTGFKMSNSRRYGMLQTKKVSDA